MKLTAVLSLRDNYTDALKRATRETIRFRNEVAKTKKVLDTTFKNKHKLDMDTKPAQAQLTKIDKALFLLKDNYIKVNIQINNFEKAQKQQSKLQEMLKKLQKAPLTIAVKLGKLAVGPFLSLLKATANQARKIMEDALQGAASLEQSSLSIEHMIAVNNKGMSTDKVKQEAADYMARFRSQAELSSFDTGQVQKAGVRAISIAQGNTNEATNLMRLAGDMAAVAPGKSLEEALEALGQLKKGAAEGLGEFGFYVDEASIRAAGNDMRKVQSVKGVALGDMFKGGGAAAGETATGLWTGIRNSLKNSVADMGKETLEILKPELKSWANFINSDGFRSMFKAGSNMMAGLAKAVTERMEKIRGWLESSFFGNEEFKNLSLREKLTVALDELKKGFNDWYREEGAGLFSSITSGAVSVLEQAAPVFGEIGLKIGASIGKGLVEGLGNIVKDHPFLSAIAVGLGVTAVGGPVAGLVASAVTLPVAALGKSLDRVEERRNERELARKEIRERMNNSTPEQPFLPDTTWGGRPEGRTFIHDIRDRFRGFFIDKGLMDPPKPKAIGISRVPYDNYPALLHQNERVLTAQEARNADNRTPVTINLVAGKQVDPDLNKLLGALRSAVEAAGFNMAPGGAA